MYIVCLLSFLHVMPVSSFAPAGRRMSFPDALQLAIGPVGAIALGRDHIPRRCGFF
jgi:hypothetical protein